MAPETAERLRALYAQHFEYVLRTARRLGASPEDMDDVAQEAFIILAKKLPELDLERPIRPYLFGVIRNVLRAFRRKKREPITTAEPTTSAAPEDSETVYALLRALPEDLRTTLVLFDVEGHTYREAAEILGVSETQARSWLRRARAMARGYLEGRR